MGFRDYITLHETAKSFPVVENRINDIIFNTSKLGTYDFNMDNDVYINEPDYTRHVFANNCEGVYFMDERNIPLPTYQHNKIHNSLINHLKNDEGYRRNNGAGIYVVERYRIKIKEGKNYMDIINAYTSMDAIVDPESREALALTLRSTTPTTAVYRVVTYIPNDTINKERYIYNTYTNLCFIKGLPGKDAMHPKSIERINKENNKKTRDSEHSNKIIINIVDNNNPYKPYYINIANKVYKLFTDTSNTIEDGCELKVKINGEIVVDEKYNLNDLENNGIYDSEYKAKHNTDIENVLKIRKLDQEDRKIISGDKKVDLEDIKIRAAYQDMSHSKFMAIMDKEMKLDTYRHSKFKMIMENINMEINNTREERLFKEKVFVEGMKTTQTVATTIMNLLKLFF